MNDSDVIQCGVCGQVLTEEGSEAGHPASLCPMCGPAKQHITLPPIKDLPIIVRDHISFKAKDNSRRSKDKLRITFKSGWEIRRSQGDYVYREYEINRDTRRAREFIRDKSGNVIKDVDEPLTDHTGHGSNKFKSVT
jgi:hypothetical protein